MYTHPGQEGGYGHGVNGIIEFNAEDLHYWLNVALTRASNDLRPKASGSRRPSMHYSLTVCRCKRTCPILS